MFDGAVISYTDDVKNKVLGVSSEVLKAHTAVSSECAVRMAQGATELLKSDIAVSVTGYAGPGDGEDGTPCGTVYIGYSDRNGSGAVRFIFDGDRDDVRRKTRDAAYGILRERAEEI